MIWWLRRRYGTISPRGQRLLGTAAASYFARFTAAVSLLVTIPLARQNLQADHFGMWMMLSSMLAFFAFADLGVGNGVLARLTHARSSERHGEAGDVMLAGYACAAACGLLLCAAWAAWLFNAGDPLEFAGDLVEPLRTEALRAFTAFVLLLAASLPVQLVHKFQLAFQDGKWVGFAQAASSLLSLAALSSALWHGASLTVLLLCTLGVQVLVNLVSTFVWFGRRRLWALLQASSLRLRTLNVLLRTGLMFFVLQLCAAFAFQSDAFVVAQTYSAAVYGDFAAIQRVYLSIATLVGAALIGLWPAFGEALGRGDVVWARTVYLRSMVLATLVMIGLIVPVSLGMPWLTSHWLGMQSAPAAMLVWVLAIWTVIDMLGQISGTLLNGAGMLKVQLLAAVVMSVVAFAAKWSLAEALGPYGVVLATILAYIAVSVPVQILLIGRLLRVRGKHIPTGTALSKV